MTIIALYLLYLLRFLIVLYLLCFLWLAWALNRTHKHGPDGYEDQDGFHLGKR